MKSLSIVCILVLFYTTRSDAKLYVCDRVHNGRTCYVENITISSEDSHQSTQFQEYLQLVIESSIIPTFSVDLFASLGEIDFLTIKEGNVSSVDFRSDTLNSLRIHKTGLRNLSIASTPNHNLNTLMINRNTITEIPSSIRFLLALSILDLSHNQIEYLSLDWFQQMDNLLVLDLSHNHLSQLEGTSGLSLRRLRNFWVSHNHLSEISWFPIGFPKLDQVRLSDNQWSCSSLATMRKEIWNRRIRLLDADGACSENSDGGLCCYHQAPTKRRPQAKYELIEIEIQPHSDSGPAVLARVVEPSLQTLTVQQEPTLMVGSGKCPFDESAVQKLKQEKDLLVKQKTEMENKYSKKLASLQEILREVKEDLEETRKEVSKCRFKERPDLISSTSRM